MLLERLPHGGKVVCERCPEHLGPPEIGVGADPGHRYKYQAGIVVDDLLERLGDDFTKHLVDAVGAGESTGVAVRHQAHSISLCSLCSTSTSGKDQT